MEPDLASQAAGASGAGAPLNGTLEDNTPAGVLQLLSSQGATGAIRFSGETACTVYLHDGELYFAETTETGEDLAIAVVRPGRLSADEWDRSTAAGYPTETVGEELIDTGSITRDLLASIVLSVIYDPLIQLFRAPEGDFEFEPGVVHWIGPFRSFSVDAIVSEVRRRTREADEMAPLVPGLDALVRTAPTLPDDRGNVNLRRDDWEVVVAASMGRTISELAVDLGRGRWSTARLVYRLASVNLVDVAVGDASADAIDLPMETTWDTPESDTITEEDLGEPADASPWGVVAEEQVEDDQVEDEAARRLSDGPPPLDLSAFAPTETEAGAEAPTDNWSTSSWDTTLSPIADEAADGDDAAASTDDSWSEPAMGTEWQVPGGTDDSPATTWDQPTEEDPTATAETPAPDGDWNKDVSTPLADEVEAAFEPPALHPDIAKALAESTYADSATAINVMAARLGAVDAADDDDWDDGVDSGGETDAFWSSDSDTGAGAAAEFTWQPAAWDTGVEAAPRPSASTFRVIPTIRTARPAPRTPNGSRTSTASSCRARARAGARAELGRVRTRCRTTRRSPEGQDAPPADVGDQAALR